MTKQELERLPALYRQLNQLRKLIKSVQSSTNKVSDSVRGGTASNGKGHIITITGYGDEKLGIKTQEYREALYECEQLITEAEQWINSLPGSTQDDIDLKTMLNYRYVMNYNYKEIGEAMNYSKTGVIKKMQRFWKCHPIHLK